LGQFSAKSVQGPLEAITGRRYGIAAFAPHIKAFTDASRGSVLVREGIPRRYTYRFRNPLLQPFTIISAIAQHLIPDDYLQDYFGDSRPTPLEVPLFSDGFELEDSAE